MRREAHVREEQYRPLRGLFYGTSDNRDDYETHVRLHSVTLDPQAGAVGKPLAELGLDRLGVQVRAVRRPGVRMNLNTVDAGPLQAGDVVVLLGAPEMLEAAEDVLLRG